MIEVIKYNLPDFDIFNTDLKFEVSVWRPERTFLVIGQSNDAERSLKTDLVLRDNILVYKRPSGGEAVIITPNTLVISLVFKTDKLLNPKEYFAKINQAIIAALQHNGVEDLHQKGISDIAIGEKKIAGSSIYRKPDKVFYHAVLNVSEKPEVIARYLLHPQKEPDYRQGRDHSEFVTSLAEEGYMIDPEILRYDLEKELGTLTFTLISKV